MNEDQLDDLKQFITTTVSQTEARLDQKITQVEARLNEKLEILEEKVDSGFLGVGEAFDLLNQRVDEQESDFGKRLTKLEQQPA